MMTERKRGFEEETKDQQNILAPKKKKALDSSQSMNSEIVKNDSMDLLFNVEEIRNFQKEAIWRQMMEYKRESLKDKELVKQLEARQLEWTKRISHLCLIWDKSSEDLKQSMSPNFSDDMSDSWLQLIVGAPQSGKPTDDISSSDSYSSENLEEKTKELCTIMRKISSQNLDRGSDKSSSIPEHHFLNFSDNEKKFFNMKSQIDILNLQIQDYKVKLADSQQELRRALKKSDRALCPISSALDSGKSLSDANSNTDKPKIEDSTTDSHPHTTSLELDAVLRISDGRLNEIKKLTEECSQLRAKIDQLTIDANSYSSEAISNHPAYLTISSQVEYFQADSVLQRSEKDKIFQELQELKASRRAYQAQLQAEEISQRQVLEQSLQKIQQDLVRVRSHRDQIQGELEERKMRDSVEESSLTELKILFDSLQERMRALVLENRRLRAHISALSGDPDGVEFYSSQPKFQDVTVTEELRILLREAEEKNRKSQINPNNIEHENTEFSDLGSTNGITNGELKKESTYENKAPLIKQEDSIESIKEKLRVSIIQKEELEKTSLLMEKEMQTIISAFSKLEEQTSHKVLGLVSKEQMIRKLIAEKAKYEEKFLALNKDREAQKAAISSLRFQNTKQLDHIKSVDEREQNLQLQLVTLEQHLLSLRSSQAQCQTALQESDNNLQMLQKKLTAAERKISVSNALIQSKEAAFEKANYELSREIEVHTETKRKLVDLESAKRGAVVSNSKDDLTELVEEYKSLLKCPSCHRNFKSHVLTRCMHVFCKSCIDSRIETRQRKCPSCGEAFGVNDVRQIYL
ncbi:E3 ubiquitin-protein ligase BRE1 [Smittium mucronatum]|uniref:E3 ubiquitin protein ligase n=1 Tax=Smittium mucronatum TaxID=133383 RepID=A0A1R0H5I5_9FUNG|nr:E3 ubiquitin-protein ligase BRE1 [Smittium mucronatum]